MNLTISGTRFLADGKLFPYAGLSFFNAIYNPAFNRDSATRLQWLRVFQSYGINVLRVWAQWDSRRGYADTHPESTLFRENGTLHADRLVLLKSLLNDANSVGIALELVFFAQESMHDGVLLDPPVAENAVKALTQELLPYRNILFQVWNEHDDRLEEYVRLIRESDPKRLVSSSHGGAGILGEPDQNSILDYLSPHTSRRTPEHINIAPREIAYLLARFGKPVVDDEPARNGVAKFGGPSGETFPSEHILHIHEVWKAGGYLTYHHDMFQTGYGTPPVPPSGIPEPEYNPYHLEVFRFIRDRQRYLPVYPEGLI